MKSIKEIPLPVPYHHTFEIYDASKIQAFMDCPRKFFFRYILGWESTEPNIHLVFGSAWHEAIEHLLNHGYDHDNVLFAYEKFLKTYKEKYPSHYEVHAAKTPENALQALTEYARQWKNQDDFKVLHTEVAGTVPVGDNTICYWKTDAIIQDKDGFWTLEHKTTGRKTGSWLTMWPLKVQIGMYTHVLNIMFDRKDVRGVKINGAVLRSSSNEFIRIPVRLSNNQMLQWLWETKHWLSQIEWNFMELSKCKDSDPVMTAFPRNGESCSKFGCPHPELCNLMTNPLQRQEEPPHGYHTTWWNPAEREKEVKKVAHLEESTEIKEVEK